MEAKAKKKKYPVAASSYTLLEEVGQGASAVDYRAKCIPFNEVVAIKVLDLERCNSNLALPQLEHSAAVSHIEQIPAHGISSILQTLLQSTITQQHPELVPNRDPELLQQVADFQNRLVILVDELQAVKLRNVNLERQLNAICNKETENLQKEGELNQQS